MRGVSNKHCLLTFFILAATCPAAEVENVEHGDTVIEAGNSFTNNSADFGTVVKFVCHTGYELKGSYRSYCRDEGWSDPKPECIRKYREP